MGQAGALLLPPRVLHHAGDVGVTPHQHTGLTETQRRIKTNNNNNTKTKKKVQLNAVIMSQGSQTSSCHRGSGRFCLCFVHLGRLCVQFPPAVGSSAQPHLLHNAQTLHLSEALTEPPLCSEYCLWKKWLFLCSGVLSNAIDTFNSHLIHAHPLTFISSLLNTHNFKIICLYFVTYSSFTKVHYRRTQYLKRLFSGVYIII